MQQPHQGVAKAGIPERLPERTWISTHPSPRSARPYLAVTRASEQSPPEHKLTSGASQPVASLLFCLHRTFHQADHFLDAMSSRTSSPPALNFESGSRASSFTNDSLSRASEYEDTKHWALVRPSHASRDDAEPPKAPTSTTRLRSQAR